MESELTLVRGMLVDGPQQKASGLQGQAPKTLGGSLASDENDQPTLCPSSKDGYEGTMDESTQGGRQDGGRRSSVPELEESLQASLKEAEALSADMMDESAEVSASGPSLERALSFT